MFSNAPRESFLLCKCSQLFLHLLCSEELPNVVGEFDVCKGEKSENLLQFKRRTLTSQDSLTPVAQTTSEDSYMRCIKDSIKSASVDNRAGEQKVIRPR